MLKRRDAVTFILVLSGLLIVSHFSEYRLDRVSGTEDLSLRYATIGMQVNLSILLLLHLYKRFRGKR